MSVRQGNLYLTLCIIGLVAASCKKQFSSDAPLAPSYYPSIIVGSDNQVFYALNPQNGQKNWQFSLPPVSVVGSTDFMPSPMLYNGMVYFTALNSDTIYKVNGTTGALVKKIVLTSGAPTITVTPFTMMSTPVADKNLMFLATMNNTLYAADTGTGIVQWEFTADGPLESSPVVYNGNVYIASVTGHVFCINESTGPSAITGDPNWEYPDPALTTTAQFVSSPAISPPYLYIGSVSDSNMYCIYLTPPSPVSLSSVGSIPIGVARWTYKTRGAIYSSPAALDGRVIFGCDDFHIYCLDSDLYTPTGSCEMIWSDSAHSEIRSSPCVSNQVIYIGSHDYNLYAVRIIDGHNKWTPFKTNGLIKSSPIQYSSMVYVASYDKNIYALDTATGTIKWQFNLNGNVECSPVINDLTNNNYNASQISGFMRQPNR